MELQGKIIHVLEPREGSNERGNWKTQDFVLETQGEYPRKMMFNVWGIDRLEKFNISEGQIVTVAFDIDAHEYNGRWYNRIRAYNVQQIQASTPQGAAPYNDYAPQVPPAPIAPTAPAPEPPQAESIDDLPF